MLGSCCSPPIRVVSNNDCPEGAAVFNFHLPLAADWPGWDVPERPALPGANPFRPPQPGRPSHISPKQRPRPPGAINRASIDANDTVVPGRDVDPIQQLQTATMASPFEAPSLPPAYLTYPGGMTLASYNGHGWATGPYDGRLIAHQNGLQNGFQYGPQNGLQNGPQQYEAAVLATEHPSKRQRLDSNGGHSLDPEGHCPHAADLMDAMSRRRARQEADECPEQPLAPHDARPGSFKPPSHNTTAPTHMPLHVVHGGPTHAIPPLGAPHEPSAQDPKHVPTAASPSQMGAALQADASEAEVQIVDAGVPLMGVPAAVNGAQQSQRPPWDMMNPSSNLSTPPDASAGHESSPSDGPQQTGTVHTGLHSAGEVRASGAEQGVMAADAADRPDRDPGTGPPAPKRLRTSQHQNAALEPGNGPQAPLPRSTHAVPSNFPSRASHQPASTSHPPTSTSGEVLGGSSMQAALTDMRASGQASRPCEPAAHGLPQWQPPQPDAGGNGSAPGGPQTGAAVLGGRGRMFLGTVCPACQCGQRLLVRLIHP